ncbi:uncharacterized protein LOC117121051, partial [Anneissia japonica]|uniref:uncharacterized protein LOC117121051 n=1 Tax=Anneissia japonica TaxID=1529436 RepID=UPI00142552E2
MKENFYVDDCLVSAPDQMKAVRMIKDLSNLCLDGGFRLTKWLSNDKEVLNTVPEAERAPELKSLDLNNDDLPTGRTLGVQWSPQLDTLSFNIAAAERNYTRRGILSITSSVFDPLGLVAPFILPAKMLLQDLCRQGLGWDELIDDFSMQRWRIWLEELKRLKEWSMPRCYKSNLSSNIISKQLHVFSDASEKGYGMCAYLKQEAQDGTIQVSLVLARSRVAPLKYVSIPRMELTAAVMAARLTDSILRELNIKEVCYWTDSQTVLKYLQSDTRRFKMFVANRVSTLLDLTKVSQWRYVRTADNPADEASRGQGIDDFLRNKRWINGPDFLDQHVEQHINPQECLVEIDENDPEVKKVSNVVVTKNQCCFPDRLISRCSSFMKLRNVVGLVLKFVRRARKNQSKSNDVDQLEAAERFIIVHEQQKHFAAELTALKNGEKKSITAVMKASPLHKLDPML